MDRPQGAGAKLTLSEALAIRATYVFLGYPNRAQQAVVARANAVINEGAKEAMERVSNGLCTTCWGDGFHRVSEAVLGGPCHACGGCGRTALQEGEAE